MNIKTGDLILVIIMAIGLIFLGVSLVPTGTITPQAMIVILGFAATFMIAGCGLVRED